MKLTFKLRFILIEFVCLRASLRNPIPVTSGRFPFNTLGRLRLSLFSSAE